MILKNKVEALEEEAQEMKESNREGKENQPQPQAEENGGEKIPKI